MQNILSAFVFRDYQRYSQEEANLFRRATSRTKHKSNRSVESTIAQTKYKQTNILKTQGSIQTSQFEVNNTNELRQLGMAINRVQQTIGEVKQTLNGPQWQDINSKQLQYKSFLKQAHENNTIPQIAVEGQGHKPRPKGFLKQFRQKMQSRKTQQKNRNKFNLHAFKNKLNYQMAQRIPLET